MITTRPPRSRRRTARARGGVLAVTALLGMALLVAGCGGASHHPHVASLQSPGQRSATTRTSAANAGIPDPDGRPRQDLDANSLRQLQTLYNPFYRCVYRDHRVASKLHTARYLASLRRATSACVRLEPLPPWPLDPANPQSRAFIGRTVTCMRQKGYEARASLDSGEGIQPPEWKVVYAVGIDNVSERVAHIQFGCQDRAQRQGSS